jgi:tRNA(Arg) A34 adenosine deaminase TadA
MCAAAIAWAGFREVWVLFGAREMEEEFDMSVDIEMYKELFGSNGVRPDNKFFRKYSVREIISESPARDRLAEILEEIEKRYAALSVADFEYPGMIG